MTTTNNPVSGMSIPIFILLSGILGGYIRYLYKAATKHDVLLEGHQQQEHSIVPIKFIHETFEEISEIALSGLIAVIVWFMLSQGTVNLNIYTLGAISLTVGLITKEIIDLLKGFAKRVVMKS